MEEEQQRLKFYSKVSQQSNPDPRRKVCIQQGAPECREGEVYQQPPPNINLKSQWTDIIILSNNHSQQQ